MGFTFQASKFEDKSLEKQYSKEQLLSIEGVANQQVNIYIYLSSLRILFMNLVISVDSFEARMKMIPLFIIPDVVGLIVKFLFRRKFVPLKYVRFPTFLVMASQIICGLGVVSCREDDFLRGNGIKIIIIFVIMSAHGLKSFNYTLVLNVIMQLFYFLFYKHSTFWDAFDIFSENICAILFCLQLNLHFDEEHRSNFLLRQKLKNQEKIYHQFLHSQTNPIIIFSSKKGVFFQNKASVDLFGEFTLTSIISTFYKFNCKDDQTLCLIEYVHRFLDSNKEDISEKEFILPPDDASGKEKIFQVTIIGSSFFEEKSTIGVSLRDVTERVEFEEAKAATQFRNMLLCGISHEMRTPLNGIIGILHIVKKKTTGKIKDYTKIALTSSFFLENKINDILDYSQIMSGQFKLHKKHGNLKSLLNRIYKSGLVEIQKRPIEFKVCINEDVPDQLKLDFKRVLQILLNLVGNAIKFTKEGQISVHVNAPALQILEFAVSDSGCGMSEEQINALFRLKSKSMSVKSSEIKACDLPGLGLTVSQLICKEMNSELKVFSEQLKGSTFIFTINYSLSSKDKEPKTDPGLPNISNSEESKDDLLIPSEQKCAITIKNTAPSLNYFSYFSGIKTLIVDDNEINRYVLRCLLKKYGVERKEASNGEQAVAIFKEWWKEEQNMLILMDLEMPVIDGLQATKLIRSFSGNANNPYIVAVTAFASENERDKCKEVGFNQFCTKPITPKSLKTVIFKFTDLLKNTSKT